MSNNERASFSGKLGFVLAAAGSAVGLGNIWRFPYLAAKYGGGIFLFVYVILAITFGVCLMFTEVAIGRKTNLSAIEAYGALDKRFKFVGYLTAIIPMIILPYYTVIGGWVMKYCAVYLTGHGKSATSDTFFGNFISSTSSPIIWFVLIMTISFVIVLLGVEKGVEKSSKVMMPILVVLSIIVAVSAIRMPGAFDGFIYYLKPDFSKFSAGTVLGALGQLFYSLSLAMGIMITYGSYMKKHVNIESSSLQIAGFDMIIAFIAGAMIIPAFYAFSGGNPESLSAGPGLMFVTLPKVFEAMHFGHIIGAVFFVLVLFAALTSIISLMETVVSIVYDKLKISRTASCVTVWIGSMIIGIPSSLGFGVWSKVTIFGKSILDFFDFASNSVLMPIVAILTCLFVGFVIKPKAVIDEIESSSKFHFKKFYVPFIKIIAPVLIIIILLVNLQFIKF